MEVTKTEYTLDDVSFCVFRDKHLATVRNFRTYNADLYSYLTEDALKSSGLAISVTFLLFPRKGKQDLLGYITLLNDSIKMDAELKEQFRIKGISYKSLPAIKVGRLCVSQDHERQGVGRAAIEFAIKKAVFSNSFSACRFITVDAKRYQDRNRDSFHFYTSIGFKALKERKNPDPWKQSTGTTPMYLDLYQIIKLARDEHKA